MKLKNAYNAVVLACFIGTLVFEVVFLNNLFAPHVSMSTAAGAVAGLVVFILVTVVCSIRAYRVNSFTRIYAVEPPNVFENREIGGVPIRDAIQKIVDAKMDELTRKLSKAESETRLAELRNPNHGDAQKVSYWMIAMEAARQDEKWARETYREAVKSARVCGFRVRDELSRSLPQMT